MNLQEMCKQLEEKIQNSYEQGVTLEEAERLASEFLLGQVRLSQALQAADLDARMKKSGVKAIRAAIYLDTKSKPDVKYTEAMLEHSVNMNDVVQTEQQTLDVAESNRDALERYFSIFREAHIHFRGISRGRFE